MPYEVLNVLSLNTWKMNADGADSDDTEGSVHSAFSTDFASGWLPDLEYDDNAPDVFNEEIDGNDGELDPPNDLPIGSSSSASNSPWCSSIIDMVYYLIY